jgi:hypothetical protein
MIVPGARGAEVDDLLLPLGLELVGIVGDQAGLVGIGPLLGVALRARKHETEGCNQHPGQVTEIRHAKLSLRAREQIVLRLGTINSQGLDGKFRANATLSHGMP